MSVCAEKTRLKMEWFESVLAFSRLADYLFVLTGKVSRGEYDKVHKEAKLLRFKSEAARRLLQWHVDGHNC